MAPASSRIPALLRDQISHRARKTLDATASRSSTDTPIPHPGVPAESVFEAQLNTRENGRWTNPPVLEDLKRSARSLGLWNLFLSTHSEGAGYTNLEYALMAECLGMSRLAPEATNNSAPDTGNMEILANYGTPEQKRRWLEPLLKGEIRSAYVMTEPNVASSDATNVRLSMARDGDHYVLNGSKWWISSAGDPRCKIYIVIGKTNPSHPDKYKQQSMIIVPADTPGIKVTRLLSVYGFDDAPLGHGHLTFNNVRVPASNMLLGEGRGFEIMQGRMGPGRIHHAMRCIGFAERALDWMLSRANDKNKQPFGKVLSEHGAMVENIARCRIEIDAARLVVLNAAAKIDQVKAKGAMKEIAEAKIFVPQVTCTVIDRAIQAFGAEGVSQDTPLAAMWAAARIVRIADGPDEVHLRQLGRNENKRAAAVQALLDDQKGRTNSMLEWYGVQDPLGAIQVPRASKL
ncbi:acyl-CoA dehydrogenase [Fonsecaea monophora]|uniref:Acyl-CoA dehydrogenase n=1 Tax=Fonsecaea monophora TaxID=254056 RepID=A0A177FJ75_9EURO|nr:acyl-CoA dehydrogenase [Fonsecaea monophora]OAG43811.1 acyl-CoA dehydrogenase [Fonsecaea monophora]